MPLESHKSRTRGFYSGMQVSIRTKNLGAGWDRPTKNGSCFFSGGVFFKSFCKWEDMEGRGIWT